MTRDSSDHPYTQLRAPRLAGVAAFDLLGRAHRDAARQKMPPAGCAPDEGEARPGSIRKSRFSRMLGAMSSVLLGI